MVQALTMIIAAVYVVVNLVADLLTILVTPRLRTAADDEHSRDHDRGPDRAGRPRQEVMRQRQWQVLLRRDDAPVAVADRAGASSW